MLEDLETLTPQTIPFPGHSLVDISAMNNPTPRKFSPNKP